MVCTIADYALFEHTNFVIILYVMVASFLKMLISACGRCFFREQVHTCVMLRN